MAADQAHNKEMNIERPSVGVTVLDFIGVILNIQFYFSFISVL